MSRKPSKYDTYVNLNYRIRGRHYNNDLEGKCSYTFS